MKITTPIRATTQPNSPLPRKTFTTDATPSVATTVPVNGASGVALNADLSVTFSEPVHVTGNWFQIVCSVSGTRNPGDTVFTPGLAGLVLGEYRRLLEAPAEDPTTPKLTERETEVLRLVAKGMSYKQIAERLVVSHRTVQNHVQNTLRKLQMHNRVELTRYAIEQGLDD